MSVKYGASGLYHRRTSSLPASNSVTLCAWFYYISARSAYSYFMGLEDTTSSSNYYALMGFDDANSLEVTTHDPSDRYFDFATAPAAGAWHFAAFAIGGATSTIRGLHMNPSNVWQTNSVAGVPSFTMGVLHLGNDSYDEWANVYLYNVKVWDTGLTDDEVKREAYSFYPVRRDKLHAHFPLSTPDDLRDLSGNNRVLTKGGTTHTTQRNPPGLGIKEERERLPLWWLGSVAAGGSTQFATFSASATGAASFLKTPQKVFSASATGAPTFVKSVSKIISVSANGSAAFVKSAAKTFALVTATGSAAFVKTPAKLISLVTATGAASFVKVPSKIISTLTATGAPTFTTLKVRLVTFAMVTATGTASFLKTPQKVFSASATGAPTFVKSVSKIISVSANGSAAFVKRAAKTFALVTATGSASFIKSALKTFTATANGAVTFTTQTISSGTITAIRHFTLRARSVAFTLAERLRDD